MGAHETPTIQRSFDTLLPGLGCSDKEASGWVETQEKVNTHPPLLQADSSILSHLCLGLFWNQFFPGDYWKIVWTRWEPFTANSSTRNKENDDF